LIFHVLVVVTLFGSLFVSLVQWIEFGWLMCALYLLTRLN